MEDTSDNKTPAAETPTETCSSHAPSSCVAAVPQRRETLRWWIKLVLQPIIFLAAGVLLIVALGVVQKTRLDLYRR